MMVQRAHGIEKVLFLLILEANQPTANRLAPHEDLHRLAEADPERARLYRELCTERTH